MPRLSVVTVLLLPLTVFAADKPVVPDGYKLAYESDFAKADAIKQFRFTDPTAWAVSKPAKDGDKAALELTKQSDYKPPHRSPVNIALLKDVKVGDCVIECECLQTGKEYGHRDMVFVFGYQNPSKYYYVHIATAADPNANNVFVVNDAPRKNIATETNKGNDWGLNKWHKVRVERTVKDGAIRVFFDDLKTPIMKATDTTHGDGWIGFGSFDDTGKVADIKVWAKASEKAEAPEFKK